MSDEAMTEEEIEELLQHEADKAGIPLEEIKARFLFRAAKTQEEKLRAAEQYSAEIRKRDPNFGLDQEQSFEPSEISDTLKLRVGRGIKATKFLDAFFKTTSSDDPRYAPLVKSAEEMHLFVFKPKTVTLPSMRQLRAEGISMPFPVCSFEFLGGHSFWPKDSPASPHTPMVYIARELSPEDFLISLFAIDATGASLLGKQREVNIHAEGYDAAALMMLHALLGQMRDSALAEEKVTERVTVKRGRGASDSVKIKNIVHVRPKSERGRGVGAYGAPLDWSHRWEVRGHWRKHEGLGKNRAGSYEVEGYTWVLPHVKGPENKLLVKKTRLVKTAELAPATPDV